MGMRKFALAAAVLLLAIAAKGIDRTVEALPPAGIEKLPVVITADVASRLGTETVVFNGMTEVTREAPHDEGGVDVSNFSITNMDLVGASSIGAISTMAPSKIGPLGAVSQAADTGGDGNGFQLNAAAAFVDDVFTSTTVAAQDFDSGTTTSTLCTDAGKDKHRFSGFETTLPSTATIQGIDVRLDAWSDATAGAPFMCVELSWDGGVSWTSAKSTTQLATSATAKTLGGSSDTWGRTWAPGDLAKNNLRVRVTNVASDNSRDFFLDFIALDVYYAAPSAGEIRSLQPGQDFPASSFINFYAAVEVPLTINGTNSPIVLHNNQPFHLTPRSGGQKVNLNAWPPLGVVYALDPIYNVDNDGDTQIDEDTPDEDNDLLIDEDRPGLDPDTPGSGGECSVGLGGPDCDTMEGEDPPLSWCIQNSSVICDDDQDGQSDEDPSCIPMYSPGNHNSMKVGLCIRNLRMEFAPELPSFSVGPNGPSGFHPADILGMTPGSGSGPTADPLTLVSCNDDIQIGNLRSQVTFAATMGTTYRFQVGSWADSSGGDLVLAAFTSSQGSPAPTAVSGNDNLSSAAAIAALPYRATQSTLAATTQPNEPLNCAMGGHTVWYSFTAPSTGSVTVRTSLDTDGDGLVDEDNPNPPPDGLDNDGDTFVDEDMPETLFDTVLAVYTGSTFSVGGTSDNQPPFVRISCTALGLTADGCDNGADGDIDNLSALSYGQDTFGGLATKINFSVGAGAQGLTGTAVRTQFNCPAPEPEPDEFSTNLGGSNTLVMDGNGPVGTCTSAFPFGFIEAAGTRDNLDALDNNDPSFVDPNGDGIPENPVYMSLGAGSPSLATLGTSAAAILKTANGAAPTVYASPAALGLQTGDDIDGLCLNESGDGTYAAPGDQIFFSLAPGSPSLATIGAGPGDLLRPGSPAAIAQSAATLGLATGDNLDAIKCLSLFVKDPLGDTDGDTILNQDDPDDDNDGCTDVKEIASNVGQGGQRNPHNFWDFFDTPDANNVRDKAVSVGDIFRIVARFGTNDALGTALINRNTDPFSAPPPTGYHPAFDRSPLGPNGWNLGPPDGSVSAGDILLNVIQFGNTCA